MNIEMPVTHLIGPRCTRRRHMPSVIHYAILALAMSVLSLPARAQSETAEVLGSVQDPTSATVADATVTLTNTGTGIAAKTTTDDKGDYDFLNVMVGDYE